MRTTISIRHRKARITNRVKNYFKNPFNSIATVVLIIGIFLLVESGNFHPVVPNSIAQTSQYIVTPNVTTDKAFTLFPGKTTFVTFSVPAGQKVNYSLVVTIEEQISPTLNNPGGVKIISKQIASGIAEPGSILVIPPQNLTFALASYFYVFSETGGLYNITVQSQAYFNTTLDFSPSYAITGMAFTAVSSTLLASVAGIRSDEF